MYEEIPNEEYLNRNACKSYEMASSLKLAANHHI